MYKIFIVLLSVSIFLNSCDGTQEVDSVSSNNSGVNSKSVFIDSVLNNILFKCKSSFVNDSSLRIEVFLSNKESVHFRRRGIVKDLSIYLIRNYIDGVKKIGITEFITDKTLTKFKPIDSSLYNSDEINNISNWEKNDPIALYLKAKMVDMKAVKYDELSEIVKHLVNEGDNMQLKSEFDQDFALILDNYISELYGEIEGVYFRKLMEDIYKRSFEKDEFKSLKPDDIKVFIDYGDLIYYSKVYSKEIKAIIKDRESYNRIIKPSKTI